MIEQRYKDQVHLLLQALPYVAKEESLALKGGTAINLFENEMPRLSVDIDLTYLPFEDRETALANISSCLGRIRKDLEDNIPNISVTTAIKNGFLIALISHMRPINEVIKPTFIDQQGTYTKQFSGMTGIEFSYEDFEETRKKLVKTIFESMTEEDKRFLLSFKKGEPDWGLFPFKDVDKLPAVKWKLQNMNKLKKENPEKHKTMLKVLEDKLLKDK